jgi:hypothetical protein
MTGLGAAGNHDRLLWPWLVVAGVAVLAAALLAVLVLRPGAEAARTVTLVTEVGGEWSRPTDDWTTRQTEMLDLALESVHPGVDISTATYVRDDGTKLSVGTMVSADGDDLDDVVVDVEGSTYGLVLTRLPEATEDVDAGPLGGTMTCTVVVLRKAGEVACAWLDRTTAGVTAIRYPRDSTLDVDPAELTREFREAVTREP